MSAYIFSSDDKFLIKLIFNIFLLFFNINLFIHFFIYTYYITFYIILIDIYILLKYIHIYNNNIKVKEYSIKIIILISIVLMHLPLSGIFFFYRKYRKWFNKILIFLLGLICLFILVLCYYSKIFFIIIATFITILFLLFISYNDNNRIIYIIKEYKFFISFIISLILYYLNNI